ncbi:sigma-w pathway protein ysdB [Bacillus sp. FJAT-27245]|uniref:sigma-w pathway protein ysdB n=1 Tax=Bacillus sp. FJAT-27245 TaxID=1684144 RepID=UPI000A613CA6|nr:sigma-w pathway protein ysdB [Bacillus sp. FJAT-27245]
MLLRLTGLILLAFILYKLTRVMFSLPRKLESAKKQKRFFLLDDKANPRKNFRLTYKGAVFEGEKYLGITGDSFGVISIFLWPKNADKLEGMTHDDFLFIKSELAKSYPHASIEWNGSVREHLRKLMSISY